MPRTGRKTSAGISVTDNKYLKLCCTCVSFCDSFSLSSKLEHDARILSFWSLISCVICCFSARGFCALYFLFLSSPPSSLPSLFLFLHFLFFLPSSLMLFFPAFLSLRRVCASFHVFFGCPLLLFVFFVFKLKFFFSSLLFSFQIRRL